MSACGQCGARRARSDRPGVAPQASAARGARPAGQGERSSARAKASRASSPRTAKTIRSSRLPLSRCRRTSATSSSAARSSGNPPTPVPKAIRASDRAPSSSAFQSTAPVQRWTTLASVVPPGCSIVAAWMTQRAFRSPPVVAVASPSAIGARRQLSSTTAEPPASAIALATPPRCSIWEFAALVSASTSRVVMSTSRTSTTATALGDFGRLVLALEALAPALDGRDELRQVHLERVEDVVGVVLGAQADLPLAGARVLDDLLGGALGLLGDLLLGGQDALALARLLDDALGLALGLGQHLLTLLDDPARLLDLLGDRGAHLVEDVVDLFLVDAHLVRQRDGLRVVDEIVQLVDQDQDVHGFLQFVTGRAAPATAPRPAPGPAPRCSPRTSPAPSRRSSSGNCTEGWPSGRGTRCPVPACG